MGERSKARKWRISALARCGLPEHPNHVTPKLATRLATPRSREVSTRDDIDISHVDQHPRRAALCVSERFLRVWTLSSEPTPRHAVSKV